MNNNYIVLLVALICAVLLLSVPSGLVAGHKDGGIEGFHTYYSYFKNYCPSTSWRSQESCAKCTNGGWCVKGGKGQCVAGSMDGPFFSEDCDEYTYGDTNIFYPNSSVYPVALTKTFFPTAQKSIRGQYRWNKLPIHPVK